MATIAKLLVALGIDSRGYSQGLDNATQQTSKFGSIVKSAAGLAVVGFAAIGGAAVGAGLVGLKFNNTMEQVTAQLNAFTKDGKKSAEILEMIKDRASKTPFEFEEMAKATASLLPAAKQSGKGLDELIGLAEILAASNPAEGLEGAAFSLKEALGGDFVSIVERFNLPRQRLNELKAQGVPALQAVQIAMKEMGLDADLVSNMANTASGRWSTFKDTMVGVAATVTKPLFDMLSGSLARVNEIITANQPLIDAFANTLATGVATGIQRVIELGTSLYSTVQLLITGDFTGGIFGLHEDHPIIGFLLSAREKFLELSNIVKNVFSGEISLGDGINQIISQFNDLRTQVVGAILAAAPEIISSLQSWSIGALDWAMENGPIIAGLIIDGLLTVVDLIIANAPTIVGALASWADSLVNWAIDASPRLLGELLKLNAKVLSWISSNAPGIAAQLASWAGAFVLWVLETAPKLIAKLGELVAQIVTWIIQNRGNIAETLARWGEAFVNWITEKAIPGITTALGSLWTQLKGWISEKASAIAADDSVGRAIWDGVKAGIANGWAAVKGFVAQKAQELLAAAKSALNIKSPSGKFADEVGAPAIQGIIVGAESVASDLINSFTTLTSGALEVTKSGVARIGTLIQESPLPTQAEELAKNTLSGFMAGIKANIGSAVDSVKSAANSLLSGAKASLEISSPSAKFAREVGTPIVLGIVQGLEKTWSLATKWLKGNLAKLTGEYLKISASMVRGNYNIYQSLRDLEQVEPYQPLVDASKAYQDASKHAIEVSGKLLDVNQAIEQLIAAGPGDLENHVKYNEQIKKLYSEQALLLQQQAMSQGDLVRLFAKQEQAQTTSMQQQATIQGIAERARQAYQDMQQQALTMMKIDAKGALEFFNQRKSQIEELAKLEKEKALATDPDEQRALDTQIQLLKAAQSAEQTAQAVQLNIFTSGQQNSDQNIINLIQRALQAAGIQVDIRARMGSVP